MKLDRAVEFLRKAEKWHRWCGALITEMVTHGQADSLDDVERVFTSILSSIATTHEALDNSARLMGLDAWAEDLDALRNKDPLLLYFWKARDTEIHDALLKWHGDATQIMIEVVDPPKANLIVRGFGANVSREVHTTRLAMYAYGVSTRDQFMRAVDRGAKPIPERVAEAGISIRHARTLALEDFVTRDKKKVRKVARPLKHLGKPIAPIAHRAVETIHGFYDLKIMELRAEARSRGASLGPVPPARPA